MVFKAKRAVDLEGGRRLRQQLDEAIMEHDDASEASAAVLASFAHDLSSAPYRAKGPPCALCVSGKIMCVGRKKMPPRLTPTRSKIKFKKAKVAQRRIFHR
jgi:hypothetical protein